MANEIERFVDRFINLVVDIFRWIWNFSIHQISVLFGHNWAHLPFWKLIVVVLIIVVIVILVWPHLYSFFWRLVEMLVALIYLIPFVFLLGLLAWVVNWFIFNVHSPYLDSLH